MNFKKNLIVIIVCLILILLIVMNLSKIDMAGYNLISKLISDRVTPIAKFITLFGSTACFLIISSLLLIFIKNKKIVIIIYSNLVLVGFFNQILKHIIKRPRPTEFRLASASRIQLSFRSFHGKHGFLRIINLSNS